MPTFKDRLKQAAAHAGVEYRQTAIANSLGVHKQTVDYWMTRDGQPRLEIAYEIARKWGVDPLWLATGEGPMLPSPTAQEPLSAAEMELVRAYRKADTNGRLSLRTVARAVAKTAVVLAFALPGFEPRRADASILHNSFQRVIHICAQLWAKLLQVGLPALQA